MANKITMEAHIDRILSAIERIGEGEKILPPIPESSFEFFKYMQERFYGLLFHISNGMDVENRPTVTLHFVKDHEEVDHETIVKTIELGMNLNFNDLVWIFEDRTDRITVLIQSHDGGVFERDRVFGVIKHLFTELVFEVIRESQRPMLNLIHDEEIERKTHRPTPNMVKARPPLIGRAIKVKNIGHDCVIVYKNPFLNFWMWLTGSDRDGKFQ